MLPPWPRLLIELRFSGGSFLLQFFLSRASLLGGGCPDGRDSVCEGVGPFVALLRFFFKERCRGGLRDPPDLSRRHLFEPLVVFLCSRLGLPFPLLSRCFSSALVVFSCKKFFPSSFLGGFVGKGLLTRSRLPPPPRFGPSFFWSNRS